LLRGDRLCGGSMDILGERFVMRLGAIAVWRCWFVERAIATLMLLVFVCDNLGIENLINQI